MNPEDRRDRAEGNIEKSEMHCYMPMLFASGAPCLTTMYLSREGA